MEAGGREGFKSRQNSAEEKATSSKREDEDFARSRAGTEVITLRPSELNTGSKKGAKSQTETSSPTGQFTQLRLPFPGRLGGAARVPTVPN